MKLRWYDISCNFKLYDNVRKKWNKSKTLMSHQEHITVNQTLLNFNTIKNKNKNKNYGSGKKSCSTSEFGTVWRSWMILEAFCHQ